MSWPGWRPPPCFATSPSALTGSKSSTPARSATCPPSYSAASPRFRSGCTRTAARDARKHEVRQALPQLGAAACQVGGLGGVACQLDGFVVRRARLVAAAQAAQQVGAGRMVGVVAGQLVLETVDGRQCYLRAVKLGDRDGPVEGDDRRGVDADQLVVEGD